MTFKNEFEDWLYYEVKSWLIMYPVSEFQDEENFQLYVRKYIRMKNNPVTKKSKLAKLQTLGVDEKPPTFQEKVENFLETYTYADYCQFLEKLNKEINK